MSKLPTEPREIRLAPEVKSVVEQKLEPLEGRALERAQAAVLEVYQSGQQMAAPQWADAYAGAITAAVKGK